jgi:hypothetical protein
MSKNRGNSQRIQHRRGSAAEWTVNNPILFAGELGYETDTTRIKFGDGVTQWVNLAYVGQFGANDLSNGPTIPSAYTLPIASSSTLGGVRIGAGISIDGSGIISASAGYTLPAATTSTLGGVIVGTGLGVSSGTVSVTYGTTGGTACQGNDARLSDARVPTSHTHGNITNAGAIGSTSGQIVVTTTSGVLTTAATISSASVSGLGTMATQNANSVAITGGSIGGTTIGATTASTGAFTTVTTTGSVGIGTTSPAARLDVQGGRSFFSASSEQYAIGARFSPAGGAVYFGAVSSSATPDAVISNAGGATLMTLQNGGNVGIWTTSPAISSGVGLHIGGSTLRLADARTPASSTATGNQGEVCWDTSYLYVCIATNTWRRIALTTW